MNGSKGKYLVAALFSIFLLLGQGIAADVAKAQDDTTTLKEELGRAAGHEKSEILNKLARAYWWDRSGGEKVIGYGKEALKWGRKFNQKEQQIEALANIGYGYLRTHKLKAALRFARKANRAAEEAESQEGLIQSLEVLQEIYFYLPDEQAVITCCKKLADLYEAKGDKENTAHHLFYVAHSYHEHLQSHLDQALDYYRKTARLYRETGNSAGSARIMTAVARLHQVTGQPDRAAEEFREAIRYSISRDMDNQSGQALFFFGKLLKQQGAEQKADDCFREAERHFQKAIKNFEEKNETIKSFFTRLFLGQLYEEWRHYREAMKLYSDSIQKYESLVSPRSTVTFIIDTGKMCIRLKKYDRAEEYLDRALNYIKGHYPEGSNREVPIHLNLGDLYFARGDYPKALSHYRKVLKLLKKYVVNGSQDYIHSCQEQIRKIKSR